MRLQQFFALVMFVVVGSGSPGPNNTLLLASGITFGFRRTVPHVTGTSVGITLLVAIAATGAGVVVTANPGVATALKITASAYLIYLAIRLAPGVSIGDATTARPFSVLRGTAFQFINPKGWVFALALASVFASGGSTTLATGLIVLAVVASIVAATAAGWAVGGSALSRVLESDRSRRWAGIVLAVMLVASVAFLWV